MKYNEIQKKSTYINTTDFDNTRTRLLQSIANQSSGFGFTFSSDNSSLHLILSNHTNTIFSCSARATTNLAFSARCKATCFCSMALLKSLPKARWVMETSSSLMWYLSARSSNNSEIRWETFSRSVSNCSALYWATTAFMISLPKEGRTRSRKSGPTSLWILGKCSKSGWVKTLREMPTVWRSLVPVSVEISRGVVRISYL